MDSIVVDNNIFRLTFKKYFSFKLCFKIDLYQILFFLILQRGRENVDYV